MGHISDDGTRLGFGAKTARFRASTKRRPVRNSAIYRASKCVAAGCKRPNRARDTTVVRVGNNRTGLGLRSNTTRFRAGTKGRPSGDLAINGAAESVAVGREGKGRANDASKCNVSYDGAGLGLGASATRLGACAVSSPAGNLAVDRTGLGVANALLFGGASITAVASCYTDLVGTRLRAGATGL
jgi:hypothetical protein